ncbi:MAG: hypothetical protein H6R14_2030 [Proteobacteria bacterium]|nr:hypothetical protein [Pseudomonadota bacterium]
MESPKTGILLLALVAATTASGALLGWHLRPPAASVEAAKPAAEVSDRAMESPVPGAPGSDKPPAAAQ